MQPHRKMLHPASEWWQKLHDERMDDEFVWWRKIRDEWTP